MTFSWHSIVTQGSRDRWDVKFNIHFSIMFYQIVFVYWVSILKPCVIFLFPYKSASSNYLLLWLINNLTPYYQILTLNCK
jgi:hypothetical protein